MECSGVLPATNFAYRKGLGTCDAPSCSSQTLQSALESGQEARIIQIDFSAAFDGSTIREFCISSGSVGIGGSVLSILAQFLSNQSQLVMVDSCQSMSTLSGVLRGSALGTLLYLLYTSELFFFLENKLISYSDDSTLIAGAHPQSLEYSSSP